MLEYEVHSDRNNLINLTTLLETKSKTTQSNDANLRSGTDAAETDSPYFNNKALHSHYLECMVSVRGRSELVIVAKK